MTSTPAWLSNELLQTALKKYFSDNSVAVSDHTNLATLPIGENYTTDFFKTSITYTIGENKQKRTIAIVIKCTHHDDKMSVLGKDFGMFEGEIAMYTKILPRINNILGSANLSPKCIYTRNDEISAIVLEDLTPFGFKMHARQNGLDLDHCLTVVEKLARLHAASAVLHKENPLLLDNYKEGMFRAHPFIIHWVGVAFDALIKACTRWPGYDKYASKLKSIQDQAIEKMLASRKKNPGDFNVLNHGDDWTNNFLFSYTEHGKVKDLRIIDFQFIVYGSPLLDLHYFWATTPNIDVRRQHFDKVFHHYHKTLVDTLDTLRYSLEAVPSEEQLLNEFRSRAFYGFVVSITTLPVVAATRRDDPTFDSLFASESEDSYRHDAYNNERYRRHMEHMLPFFDSVGALNRE